MHFALSLLLPLPVILVNMMTHGLLLFSTFAAVAFAQQGQAPSHSECINLLYQGFSRLNSIPPRVMMMEDLNTSGQPTCEGIALFLDTLAEDFNHAGCSWGMPTPVFKAR